MRRGPRRALLPQLLASQPRRAPASPCRAFATRPATASFTSGALSLNGRRILALVNGDGRRVRDDRLSNTLASGAETPTLPLAGYPDPRNPYCPSANPNPYPYPYPKPGRGPVQVPVGRGRAEQGGVGSGHVRGRAKDAPALGGAAGAPYRREPAIQEHRVALQEQHTWTHAPALLHATSV